MPVDFWRHLVYVKCLSLWKRLNSLRVVGKSGRYGSLDSVDRVRCSFDLSGIGRSVTWQMRGLIDRSIDRLVDWSDTIDHRATERGEWRHGEWRHDMTQTDGRLRHARPAAAASPNDFIDRGTRPPSAFGIYLSEILNRLTRNAGEVNAFEVEEIRLETTEREEKGGQFQQFNRWPLWGQRIYGSTAELSPVSSPRQQIRAGENRSVGNGF